MRDAVVRPICSSSGSRSSPEAGMQATIRAAVLPDPRVRPRKRAHRPAGAEEPLPRLVRLGRELLEKRRRSRRAQDPRHARRQLARFDQPRIHAVHADRSRLVRGVPGEPDASLAEAPRQARLEQPERRPVNLRRPRRPPGSPRGDQLLEPRHRCRRVPRRPGSGIPSGIAPPRAASRRSSGRDRE